MSVSTPDVTNAPPAPYALMAHSGTQLHRERLVKVYPRFDATFKRLVRGYTCLAIEAPLHMKYASK